ncbi:hypothetical protein SAMN04487930_106195 [Cytophaga hutchinsonii ATCC 33406]|nr:hypothetical protein SAMN04487930_106195 [Cytophaga hutchinsonii ATCC 33406]
MIKTYILIAAVAISTATSCRNSNSEIIIQANRESSWSFLGFLIFFNCMKYVCRQYGDSTEGVPGQYGGSMATVRLL